MQYEEYEPYGAPEQQNTGASVTSHLFTGKELDDSTGLYDYAARQYDPKLGRFITPDTVEPKLTNPQTLNRYSYTLNNPLRYIDPSGNDPISVTVIAYINTLLSSPDLQTDLQQMSMDAATGDYAGVAMDAVGVAVPGLSAAAVKGAAKAANKVKNVIKTLTKGDEFVHVAPKIAEEAILKKGINQSKDGFIYLTKEKHLKNVPQDDLYKKLYKKEYQNINAIKNRFKDGAIKVEIEGIAKPKYYNRTTSGGIAQWRYKGNIPPSKIKRIKDY